DARDVRGLHMRTKMHSAGSIRNLRRKGAFLNTRMSGGRRREVGGNGSGSKLDRSGFSENLAVEGAEEATRARLAAGGSRAGGTLDTIHRFSLGCSPNKFNGLHPRTR